MTKIKIIQSELMSASVGTRYPIRLGVQVIGDGKIISINPDNGVMILEVTEAVATEFRRLTKSEQPNEKGATRDGGTDMDDFYSASKD